MILCTVQVFEYYICSVYMGNACIRAYGDSLIKAILAGKVTRVSHKPCEYNIQIPRLYIVCCLIIRLRGCGVLKIEKCSVIAWHYVWVLRSS
jgi:hypothetical protein